MDRLSRTRSAARARLARVPALKRLHRVVVKATSKAWSPVLRVAHFGKLPAPLAAQLAYEVMLNRPPDPVGLDTYLPQLANGSLTADELALTLRGSAEFETRTAFTGRTFGPSLHVSRCRFIQSLPQARRILDLGGTSLQDPRGALVSLGYPYTFDNLTIVDLPSDERHDIYKSGELEGTVDTERGPVTYRYHSMVDLSGIGDETVDLVYSGQSIEHVSPEDGALVASQVFRILRPGGHFAIDTPNAAVTRLQQEEFVDPDHKVEYTWKELERMLTESGFEVDFAKGLNYGGHSVATGTFDIAEVAGNPGIYDAIEDCYLLAAVARKPV